MTSFRFPGSPSSRHLACLGLALAGLTPMASATTTANAGSPDFTAAAIQVVQTIPDIQLIADKPAFVRCVFQTSGTVPGGTEVDGLLRVFVDGVEAPYSPLFSVNGPIVPPQPPSIATLDDSLNFIFLPPESNDVVLQFEVNPAGPGQVSESDFSNNINSTGQLNFQCTGNPELVYVPIDYRPGGGGTPNIPSENLIKPSVGDNFIQGIYPSEDWDYFAAAPKLWTGNLNGSGSALNSSLLQDLLMMVPQPDMIYGWVPGSLPYNGQAIGIPGRAGMGNTQTIRHQRTFAHELGHLFGRFHISSQTGEYGVDVEHHLAITEGLPQLKVPTLNDVMVAGLLTQQAWIYETNWNAYLARPEFACGAEEARVEPGDNMVISGLWHRNESRFELTHTLVFDTTPTPTVPVEEANLIVRAHANGQVHEFGLLVITESDSCASEEDPAETSSSDSWEGELAIAGVVTSLPSSLDPHSIDRIEIVEVATGVEMARVTRSSDRPQVQLVTPTKSALISDQVQLEWAATDADGGQLQHFVRYSPDGVRMVPVASNLTDTRLTVDMSHYARFESGKGFFEILTTDGGLNTTRVVTDELLNAEQMFGDGGGNPPLTEILTPDAGLTFPVGATVILHCSGWDLEDLGIRGTDLVWTSSMDGVIGTGRITTTADLSVGAHIITVTATDSDGMTATDIVPLTITSRPLPGTTVTCQADLGFGGPGTMLLEVCGGDLSSGTTANVTVTGGGATVDLFLISSDTFNPTPSLGGTLVPVPIMNIVPGATDINGNYTLPGGLAGGGGPGTLYAQVVTLDPAIPTNFAISNAVQIEFLP